MIETAPQQAIAFDSQHHLLGERAAQWMARNHEVLAIFERFALELADKGRRFGIALLAERVRWFYLSERDAHEDYGVNNSYRAYIARELIRRHPRLADFIETRESKRPSPEVPHV